MSANSLLRPRSTPNYKIPPPGCPASIANTLGPKQNSLQPLVSCFFSFTSEFGFIEFFSVNCTSALGPLLNVSYPQQPCLVNFYELQMLLLKYILYLLFLFLPSPLAIKDQ